MPSVLLNYGGEQGRPRVPRVLEWEEMGINYVVRPDEPQSFLEPSSLTDTQDEHETV